MKKSFVRIAYHSFRISTRSSSTRIVSFVLIVHLSSTPFFWTLLR